jgi:hypothetical protein
MAAREQQIIFTNFDLLDDVLRAGAGVKLLVDDSDLHRLGAEKITYLKMHFCHP